MAEGFCVVETGLLMHILSKPRSPFFPLVSLFVALFSAYLGGACRENHPAPPFSKHCQILLPLFGKNHYFPVLF
jgi:hypothetical protein